MLKPILILLGSLVLLVLVFVSGVIITANVIAEPEPHKFAHLDTPDLWTSKPKEVDVAKQSYERVAAAPPTASEATDSTKTADGKLAPSMASVAQAAAATMPGSDAAKPGITDGTMTAAIDPQANNGQSLGSTNTAPLQQASTVSAALAQSCFARYRSYRVEDNSYQPFDGGPRRLCVMPGQTAGAAVVQGGVQTVAAVQPRQPIGNAQQYRTDPGPIPPENIPYDDRQASDIDQRYGEAQAVEAAAPGGSHAEWCYNRYRSYRPVDNSYQPLDGGPRRACQSPFG